MKENQKILKRLSDNKFFKFLERVHWSRVISFDQTEEDLVKWYGTDDKERLLFVSNQQGHSYVETDFLAELTEALQWYVDNDDVNNNEENRFWLDGLKRAQDLLEAI